MQFDPEGHLSITPKQLFSLAHADRRRLIDHYLLVGTPIVFPDYSTHYDFLRAVSERIGVHPRNLVLRGSCQIGFSITPRFDKVWMEVGRRSDLDLAIIDAGYFERIDREVIRWEEHNRADRVRGLAARRFSARQQDRFFNCCRVKDLPEHLFPDHFDAMRDVARQEHCGLYRDLNAFIFRDWWALRARYEFDLRELTEGVPNPLPEPPDRPKHREGENSARRWLRNRLRGTRHRPSDHRRTRQRLGPPRSPALSDGGVPRAKEGPWSALAEGPRIA